MFSEKGPERKWYWTPPGHFNLWERQAKIFRHLLPLNQRTPEVNTPLTRLVGSAFPLPRSPDYVFFSYRGTNRQGCPQVRPRRPTHVLEAHLARPLPSAPSAFRGKPSPCVRTHQRAFYRQTDSHCRDMLSSIKAVWNNTDSPASFKAHHVFMNGPASSFALPVGIGGSEALPPKQGGNAGHPHKSWQHTGSRQPVVTGHASLGSLWDSAWAFLICNNAFEGLPTLRWDEMTDYPEVVPELESFWAAADSARWKHSVAWIHGFCPHHRIPGMPFSGPSQDHLTAACEVNELYT